MLRLIIGIIAQLIITGLGGIIAQPLQTIKPYNITVGYNKTSNIIFPYAIKSVDIGNENIIAQIAKGVDNILQVKSDNKRFEETNISIVTSDARFYSFLVNYQPDPQNVNFVVAKDDSNLSTALLKGFPISEATYNTVASNLAGKKKFLHEHTTAQLIRFSLPGIYYTPGIMWWVIRLANKSQVDYTPESFRFFMTDKKRSKRTAIQQKEIAPLYSNTNQVIAGMSSNTFVFAFPAFTIPATQRLVIQVSEKNGGRYIEYKASSKTALKAKQLFN